MSSATNSTTESDIELRSPATSDANAKADDALIAHQANTIKKFSRKDSNREVYAIRDNHGFFYGLVRRLLAIITPLFGFFNSISMVSSAADLLSRHSQVFTGDNNAGYINTSTGVTGGLCIKSECDANSYAPGSNDCKFSYTNTDGISMSGTGFTQCCSQRKISVYSLCDYTSENAYLGFLAAWCAVWSLVILTVLFFIRKYNTDDLRYYIALERTKFHIMTKINCFLVVALSIIGLAYVLYTIEKSDDLPANKSSQRMNIIVSTLLNIKSILPLVKTMYPYLSECSMHEHFPNPIHINHGVEPVLGNLWGLMLTNDYVFRHVEDAVLVASDTGDESDLLSIGNPAALKRAMVMLSNGIVNKPASAAASVVDTKQDKELTKTV